MINTKLYIQNFFRVHILNRSYCLLFFTNINLFYIYIIPLKQSCNHVELTNFFKKYIIQENTTLLYIKFNFVYQLLFTKHKISLVIQLYSKVQSYNNILFFLQFFWYKHSLYKHNTCHKCHKENRG